MSKATKTKTKTKAKTETPKKPDLKSKINDLRALYANSNDVIDKILELIEEEK